MKFILCLIPLCFAATTLHAAPDDLSFEDFEEPAKPSKAPAVATPAPTETSDLPKRWYFIAPAFVVHGQAPMGGANLYMPRRMNPNGRFVATPGVGVEYAGHSSFDFAAAFVKDCYDNPAGAVLFGQHWRIGESIDIGYNVGVYVRQTPIQCLTSTTTTTSGGSLGQPKRTNTLTTTSCAFEDNLPLRYTFMSGGGRYVDIIPTPFLNLSVRLTRWPTDIYAKAISNFYLNEIGISLPFY